MSHDILPEFDERGCLPEGIYTPELNNFFKRFVEINEHRKELFEKYREFTKLCVDMKGVKEHYFDGSYVTNKEKPNDIDVLVLFDKDVYFDDEVYNIYIELAENQQKVKDKYSVHSFFVEKPNENDPIEVKVSLEHEIDKIKGWWSRFYLDDKKTILDDKKKGYILFYENDLKKIAGDENERN